MLLRPSNVEEVSARLRDAGARGEIITSYDLSWLNRVLAHIPEDMTVTVEAGATLAALQTQLATRGQWLPIDPPTPNTLSIGALLATNASGPRRFGFGTIRDHLIGIKVALADGQLIKAGGQVVKNVAGYDLCKLFVGSQGTLGIIVEATFKLLPLPEVESFVALECKNLAEAESRMESVLASPLTPVVFDLHNVNQTLTLVLGFSGTSADVAWSLTEAKKIGFEQSASLDYEPGFWINGNKNDVRRLSVLPSKITESIRTLEASAYVARAGNGVIYYRGGKEPVKDHLPTQLLQRLKAAYDPKRILPELKL